MWKFLIYTEVATNLYRDITSRPPFASRSADEQEFVQFVEKHQLLVLAEFSERMETVIAELCVPEISEHIRDQRMRISEILHIKVLGDLRDLLGRLLTDRERVVILVDNLDKAWHPRENLGILSDFLFGLLSASQTIAADFQRNRMSSKVAWHSVNLSLIVFLRSDIFTYVMSHARESDKISHQRLDWTDRRLLQRVIEERFVRSEGGAILPESIWETYFHPTINGKPVQDFICDRIIPRPRDLIFFCRSALANAINRGHSEISASDVFAAEMTYSEHAFNSLVAETEAQAPEMEQILYEFAGQNPIMTEIQVMNVLESVAYPKERAGEVIDLLIEHTFLGIETSTNRFEFMYEKNRMPVLTTLAERVTRNTGTRRFRINLPFHAFLEITE